MNIVKQTKKAVTLELTPLEMDLLKGALVKESSARKKAWQKVNPQFPEELIYHFTMASNSEEMKSKVFEAIHKYQRWGILK